MEKLPQLVCGSSVFSQSYSAETSKRLDCAIYCAYKIHYSWKILRLENLKSMKFSIIFLYKF